ncbi:transposable element Tcb1 transposase [Trichonephila clavipes]|nr:transposable element Tcb1 transposase [Trichonephila clavipes]
MTAHGQQNEMTILYTDECCFCLQYDDGWIRVWRHHGERQLNCCVMDHHTGPEPGIMVRGGIVFTATLALPVH